MRVLFIDDEEIRVHVAREFFLRCLGLPTQDLDFVWVLGVPPLEVIRDYDVVSFDNDLGPDSPGGDTLDQLRRLIVDDMEGFRRTFQGRKVVVHSMNPVAADRIATTMKDFGALVTRVPFFKMKV